MTIPHRANKSASLAGYFIPKDTIVNVNMYAIHMDPVLWDGDLEEFRPERFLDESEERVIKRDAFVPFGIGLLIFSNVFY